MPTIQPSLRAFRAHPFRHLERDGDRNDGLEVGLGIKARMFRIRPALTTIEPATGILIVSGIRARRMIQNRNDDTAKCQLRLLFRHGGYNHAATFKGEEKRTEDVTEEDVRRMANIFGARSDTNKAYICTANVLYDMMKDNTCFRFHLLRRSLKYTSRR
jgi:hypothetical protein